MKIANGFNWQEIKMTSVCIYGGGGMVKDVGPGMLRSPVLTMLYQIRTKVLKTLRRSFLFPVLAQLSYLTSN